MSDAVRERTTVSTHAAVAGRCRPAVMLAVVPVRAAGATLELALAEAGRRAADTVRRLTRLGAGRAWAGEPHGNEHADPDPTARMVRATAGRRQPTDAPADRPEVNVAVAATWELAGQSPEQVLLLADRLRFEAAADEEPPAPPAAPPDWADPAAQIQQMMAAVAAGPPVDRSPRFLFLGRPTDEQLAAATAEAVRRARQAADRLAAAVGRRLGPLASVHGGIPGSGGRSDRLMEQQRCMAVLASVGYDLPDGETVSDDPRATEFAVTVNVTHHLE